MRRILAVAMIGVAMLAACGGGEKDKGEEESAPTEACGAAPASQGSVVTKLPDNFPTPDGVTYTGSSTAGPSTIVDAYFAGELPDAFDEYTSNFHDAGYTVTSSEQESRDAEVNWSGGNATGQVKMEWPCKDRVELTITIRPA